MGNDINVAGVTFANPDDESRQTILRNFGFGYRYALLQQTIFNNERAVEVWIDGKQVGYIPKKELNNPLSYKELLIAQITAFKERGKTVYCAILSPVQKPSEIEQLDMTRFCNIRNLPVPTVLDKRAYEMFKYQHS